MGFVTKRFHHYVNRISTRQHPTRQAAEQDCAACVEEQTRAGVSETASLTIRRRAWRKGIGRGGDGGGYRPARQL
jgi:hypothetical protein